MQHIVSKGKDVTEAVNTGLGLIEATKKEVNIEVIQYETKGFLGIGAKPAVVKLTKIDTSTSKFVNNDKMDSFELLEQTVSAISDNHLKKMNISNMYSTHDDNHALKKEPVTLEGKVWVKDGQLYCKSSPTHFPMITINEKVKFYKNNQRVLETTTLVYEKDIYNISVENEEQKADWKIYMDENKLKVFLEIRPGFKIIRSISDVEPDHHIELTVAEQKEVYNSLNYEEVMKKLESLRVIHGFNQDEILKAINATESSTFEIATGINPTPGRDGWLENKVDLEIQEGPKENEDGKVDYREIKTIPTVERGKLIAIVHPPIPGKIGFTVTNEPLPAKQTFAIKLNVGKGATVVEDKIIATDSGRPLIEKRGQLVKVSIMSKLTHPGNVNISSGNIRFVGDVEVLGEVEDGMAVEAEGNIIVQNTVNMAKLTTSGAIVVYSNVIGSEVSAGKNNMLITELGHLLGIMDKSLEKIIGVIKQLTQSPAFKSSDFSRVGLQPLINILLEKKFKNFRQLAKKYVEVVRKGEDYLTDDNWRQIGVTISQLFLSLSNEVTSLERVIQLSNKIKELHEFSSIPVEPDSYITIDNTLNSQIYCSGNVLVLGQGCVNSKIHAGGTLKISGILRGGEVYGRLGVQLNEVGSESGTATLIAVPSDQNIQIKKAMEGTKIKIGNVTHVFKDTRYLVTARLDNDERIIFE